MYSTIFKMLQLHQFLARFKNITNTEKAKKELLTTEISKVIGVPITHQQISFSKNTIFIKVPPIIKAEILLKRSQILEIIKTLPGLSYISDIQ